MSDAWPTVLPALKPIPSYDIAKDLKVSVQVLFRCVGDGPIVICNSQVLVFSTFNP
jgi:hypothetical protein